MAKKRLFLDRDGTVAGLSSDGKTLRLVPKVIPALAELEAAGFSLILMVEAVPSEDEAHRQAGLLDLLGSQGIHFEAVLVCPHSSEEECLCRKPHLGLLRPWLTRPDFDAERSWIIGNEPRDLRCAENAGLRGALLSSESGGWRALAARLVASPRVAEVQRVTKETQVRVKINLDAVEPDVGNRPAISTGIGYFDHMLEQLAKHGGFSMEVKVVGDLEIDEHHTVEDTALGIGEALRKALGDKHGIGRYGFVLPMDEAECAVSLDLSGRAYLVFEGEFPRETVGELPTELVSHFYRSFADALGATLHVKVRGENAHHMVESSFKSVGRALRAAAQRSGKNELPSTKGVL